METYFTQVKNYLQWKVWFKFQFHLMFCILFVANAQTAHYSDHEKKVTFDI